MKEIFKDIPGYEGLYKISNLGKVKSLSRKYTLKENIKKSFYSKTGYEIITLHKNNTRKCFTVHVLVAMAFLNHKPCGHKLVVHHINNNKKDNNLKNLQIITQRENAYTHYKSTSKYKGVNWHKNLKKYTASIWNGKKLKHLGCFDDEYKAHLAYKKALNKLL